MLVSELAQNDGRSGSCRSLKGAIAPIYAVLLMFGIGCSASGSDPNPFVAEPAEVVTVQHPQVALDGNGFATVTNIESRSRGVSSQRSVQASRYSFSDGLFRDTATLAGSVNLSSFLASDQSGSAIQFFDQPPSTNCRFQSTLGWSCAGFPSFPPLALAMDGAGRALAVSVVSGFELRVSHFVPVSGWGTAQTLDTDSIGGLSRDGLVYWNGGVGFAVWNDRQGNVRASRFLRSADSWEPSQILGPSDTRFSPHIALARNAVSASALAVWKVATGEVQYSRYIPGGGWQGTQAIPLPNPDPNELLPAQLAIANNGEAILVGRGPGVVKAARFRNGTWEAVQTIGSSPELTSDVRIVMDGVGNAMTLFVDTARNLVANRFSVVSGWQGSQTIGNLAGTADTDDFDIDMDEAGRAMVVWSGDAGPAFPLGSSRLRTYVSGGFTVSLTPIVLPVQRNGDSQRATVSITRLGYTGPVDLQHFDCPAKVICVFDRSQIPGNENSAGLTFLTNLNDPALAGNYVVRVTGTGGGVTTEAFIEVQIQ